MSRATQVPRTFLYPASSQQSASRAQQPLYGQPNSRSEEGWDFSRTFEALHGQYELARAPIEVNFRKLAPFNSGVDRLTHLIHSYPAKVLLNIPLFFSALRSNGKHRAFAGPLLWFRNSIAGRG